VAERRPARLLGAFLAVLLVVTGCGVEDDGSAVPVRRIPPGALPDEPVVREQRTGPQPGGTPEQSVTGFLDASRFSVDRHAQSRSFLTEQAERSWRDDGPVRVVTVASVSVVSEVRAGQPARVRVVGRTTGQVEPNGAFTDWPADRDPRIDQTFTLQAVDGLWRLEDPPRGVWLRDVDFRQAYRSVEVYFLDRDRDVLVPDLRYIDRLLPRVAQPTAVVRALLGGPSRWIAPGVRTAFPPGTRLLGNVAPAADEEDVVVDLSSEVESASQPERRLIAAQLGASLAQYTGVRVQVSGRPLVIDGLPEVQAAEQWEGYDPNAPKPGLEPYYVARGRLDRLDPGDRTVLPKGAPAPPVVPEAASGVLSAGLSDDGRGVALVRRLPRGGLALHVGFTGEQAPLKLTAARITRPTWGLGASDGALVAVEGTRLLRVGTLGSPVAVRSPGLAGRPVTALRVAPDGVRVALVAGAAGQARLYVGLLARPDGPGERPEELVQLREVGGELGGVVDVGWSSRSTLFTVASTPDGPLTWDVSVDGATQDAVPSAGLPAAPVAVAAAPGETPLAEVRGQIYRRFTGQWSSPVPGVPLSGSSPFYPG